MLIAHGPLSYITNYVVFKKRLKEMPLKGQFIFFAFTFLVGILPDFDFFYLAAKNLPMYLHHNIVSHTPIFWIMIFLLLKLVFHYLPFEKYLKIRIKKEDINLYINAFGIGVLTHLIGDILIGYTMVLYPFSNYGTTILGDLIPNNPFSGYTLNPLFALEMVVCAFSISLFFSTFIKIKLRLFSRLLISFSLLLLPIYLFFYIKTYIPSDENGDDGFPRYDIDNDGLINWKDLDVDNNGIDNYKQLDKRKVAEEVKKIINERELVGYETNNIYQKTLYLFGGLSVERAILLACDNTGQPIEPVLISFAKDQNINEKDVLFSKFFTPYPQTDGDIFYLNGSLGIRISQNEYLWEIGGNPRVIDLEELIKNVMLLE